MEETALVVDLLQLIKGYYDELDTINRDRTTVGLQPTGIRERIHVWNPSFYTEVDPEELDSIVNRLRNHLDRTRQTVQDSRRELALRIPSQKEGSKGSGEEPTSSAPSQDNSTHWLFLLGVLVFLFRK